VSRHFLWQRNLNAIPAGSTFIDQHPENRDATTGRAYSAAFLRPIPAYANINMGEFASTANYNSAQLSFQRRMTRGFQAGFSYTFGRALGTASQDNTGISPFFAPRQRNYGPLNHDRTHVASLRYSWILPRPGGRYGCRLLGIVTDGWEISGISRFISGAPFTPGFTTVDSEDITGTPAENARIYVLHPDARPAQRFGRPAHGTFGNGGPNILRGPGVNNWDMSLYRTFRMAERKTLQFRLETYNTFNHTQFSALTTTARFDRQGVQIDPLFLEPSAARSPRRVQLAIRLNW
jgi:hypothetical protein